MEPDAPTPGEPERSDRIDQREERTAVDHLGWVVEMATRLGFDVSGDRYSGLVVSDPRGEFLSDPAGGLASKRLSSVAIESSGNRAAQHLFEELIDLVLQEGRRRAAYPSDSSRTVADGPRSKGFTQLKRSIHPLGWEMKWQYHDLGGRHISEKSG